MNGNWGIYDGTVLHWIGRAQSAVVREGLDGSPIINRRVAGSSRLSCGISIGGESERSQLWAQQPHPIERHFSQYQNYTFTMPSNGGRSGGKNNKKSDPVLENVSFPLLGHEGSSCHFCGKIINRLRSGSMALRRFLRHLVLCLCHASIPPNNPNQKLQTFLPTRV